MEFVLLLLIVVVLASAWRGRKKLHNRDAAGPPIDLSVLPDRFVIYDLETTGLDSEKHEIIEIGAIRVNKDSDYHETFQALVLPSRKISKRITNLTGITQEMVQADGLPLDRAIKEFREFIGDLHLVAFNAQFDSAFLNAACSTTGFSDLKNKTSCALKMARRAWPGRDSYRLADLARDGNLSDEGTHRALGDCRRTMTIYVAAAHQLQSHV